MIEFLQMLAAMFPSTAMSDAMIIVVGLLVFCVFGFGMALISKYVIPNEPVNLRGATPYNHDK